MHAQGPSSVALLTALTNTSPSSCPIYLYPPLPRSGTLLLTITPFRIPSSRSVRAQHAQRIRSEARGASLPLSALAVDAPLPPVAPAIPSLCAARAPTPAPVDVVT